MCKYIFEDSMLDKWHIFQCETCKLPDPKSSAQLIHEGILTEKEVEFIIRNYQDLRNHWLNRYSKREEDRFNNFKTIR